jgi:hypothetical protein
VAVELLETESGWSLLRGGEPYALNGVGGAHDLDTLVEAGGSSFRTWGVGPETAELLDQAHARGLTVSLGIWLGHERHGFDYGDPEQVAEQHEAARQAVLAHKDHPALLMWGVGNEMEGFESGDDPRIWSAVCAIAEMVQELDPLHPVMSTTADIGGGRIASVHGCPHIDIHGINSYGGGPSIVERYRAGGGTKPIVLTEYGPPGVWEIPKTDYGAPPERTSTQKAQVYATMAREVIGSEELVLGGYAFLWGWKTEATATWFGLFLPDGTRLGGVDALAEIWGKPLANRAPRVSPLTIAGGDRVEPGARIEVSWTVEDPDGDPITTHWELRREIREQATGGDPQGLPPAVREAVIASTAGSVLLQVPESNGVHRLYAIARDGRGAGATASLPILVGEPRAATDPLPMPWWVYQDHGVGGPWVPSGWMGAEGTFELDTDWRQGCASPPSCIRVETTTGEWNGVAWQTPPNNWGELGGGPDLGEARWLKFRVRGDIGVGRATFGVGLVGEDKSHPDSLRVEKTVRLDHGWREVRIRLRGDPSQLITGFWWVLPPQQPLTMYVDEIRFE